jgi:hypothetical protein
MNNAREVSVEEPKVDIERSKLSTLVKVETLPKVVTVRM